MFMRYTVLGKSELRVSAVGLGGIPIMRPGKAEAVKTIQRALELGVNFIDTAACYGDSQTKIGAAIHDRREGLVLASKSGAQKKDEILADIDKARKEMRTDVIDLYQLHGVSSRESWQTIAGPGGALEGLLEARDKGIISHIGFTSHDLDLALELVEQLVFATVQFPFNLVTSEPADELIPKAAKLNLGFIAMKPLCGGQYDDAQLAFKFLNQYPNVVPIPGIEHTPEIEEIAAVVASGETLAGEEKAKAQKIAEKLGKLFCRRCGYCEPCPNGVPISTCMIFDGIVKRMPRDIAVNGVARSVAENASKCVECGECEKKCPYNLPIIETIKGSLATAQRLVAESQ